MLEIIFEDNHIVCVNKPHGLAMHKSNLVRNTNEFVVDILKDQLQTDIYTVHRLDRKTSGVLLIAKSLEAAQNLSEQFAQSSVKKTYFAISRGYLKDIALNYELLNDKGISQECYTEFKNVAITELPIAFGQHQTSRYSLVKALPLTGRMHQIRRHLAHLRHPIIGDRPHGCNKQNRFFKANWNMTTMMLHARQIEFIHPATNEISSFKAPFSREFERVHTFLNFELKLIDL